MNRKTISRCAALALVAWAGTACESGTGPDGDTEFDSNQVVANHQAFERVVQDESLESFRAATQRASFQAVAGPITAAADVILDTDTRSSAIRLSHGLVTATWSAANPIISAAHLGKTFVYDPTLDDYKVDPERGGAPSNGVRFILYEVDANDTPIVEQEIGHVDLIDQGEGSVTDADLRLEMVLGQKIVIDYRTTVDLGIGTGAITVDGFIQPEEDRLDFDIDLTGVAEASGGTAELRFNLSIADRDFSIAGAVTGIEDVSGENGWVELTVRHGNDSFRVEVDGSDTEIDGTVYLNGEVLALVTGDPEDPTLSAADGGGLTASQLQALGFIVKATEGVFFLVGALLEPVAALVLLAFLL